MSERWQDQIYSGNSTSAVPLMILFLCGSVSVYNGAEKKIFSVSRADLRGSMAERNQVVPVWNRMIGRWEPVNFSEWPIRGSVASRLQTRVAALSRLSRRGSCAIRAG